MNAHASERRLSERFFGAAGTSNSRDGHQEQAEDKGHRYYITLAPISSGEDEQSNCSSAVYDSIHNRETDFCNDSDDYSSDDVVSTASDVTVPAEREVIEFDVVTASSDDGEYLYLEDSSSGTDNYIIDKRIFVLQDPKSSDSFSSGATSCTPASISGDVSEDSPDEDPELRPADYWKCVKCNNSQNNPRYRFCEKCYQLRKNYFPPRPKISKTRQQLKKTLPTSAGGHQHSHHHHHNAQSSSDCLTSGDEEAEKRTSKRFKPNTSGYNSSSGNRTGKSVAAVTQAVVATGAAASSSAVSSAEEGNASVTNGASIIPGRSVQAGEEVASSSVSFVDTLRKRPNSSQSVYRTEGEEEEGGAGAAKKLKMTSSDEGCSGVGSGESQEEMRPKHLNLATILGRGLFDSGCSSYSSGQESIPSPVDHSSSTAVGSKCLEGLSSTQEGSASQTEPLLGHSQMTISLSRDFHGDKGSYSDSETYRRTSSKCVVNKGEANAILRRLQGDLLMESKSGLEGEELPQLPPSSEIKTSKSMMEQYAEQKEEEDRVNNLCIICVSAPKDSAFVHTRTVHISCCYRCAIKVWNKKKRCPICNCKVKNVLKCYVH